MNDLVILKKDDVFTTSKVIADGTGISHKKIKNAINKYKTPMETFGKVVSYGNTLPSGQTDAIKELVEYAQANGSTNANRYYAIYSRLADKVVGIQNRDEAHISQLNTLSVVEAVMGSTIHECIANGMEYHEVYKVCRKRLAVFTTVCLERVS